MISHRGCAGPSGSWTGALLVGLAALFVIGVLAAPASADENCQVCHSNSGLVRSSDGSSVYVNPASLRNWSHSGVPCTTCHADAEPIPHKRRLAGVTCASCHGDIAEDVQESAHAEVRNGGKDHCAGCHGRHGSRSAAELGISVCQKCHGDITDIYRSSVHGVALANGDPEASTCQDCHGPPHEALPHANPEAPTNRANLAETCAECHADREMMIRRQITIPEAYTLYQKSVHGRSENGLAATCNDCHESHDLRRVMDPLSSIHRTNISHTCGRCHEQEAADYDRSIHGVASARGVMASPICTDCHGEHLIRGPTDPNSPVGKAGIIRTCSHCHEAEGIRETYGLAAGRLSTFNDSFHGLASKGGSPVVANCASCHGYHLVLPSTDSGSTTHPENLPVTCGKCHPGAGEKFAKGKVHEAMTAPSHPVLNYVRIIYIILILFTIGGMSVHNGLDFWIKVRNSLRTNMGKAAALADHSTHSIGRYYERMTGVERIQHGLLATSFLVLVYTGFALTYSESFLFSWFARLEGGYAWRSHIHRWAAVIMVLVSIFHVFYLMTRRGRSLLMDMLPRFQDAKDLVANGMYLTGMSAKPPRFERFGYIEKAEYWALIWGTVVMTLTGFILWFENQSLQFLDKWLLDLATIVHFYEAWLAFLAIVVWHFYYVIFNPDVYPINWTFLTGRVSEELMEHEHPRELERIKAAEAAAMQKSAGQPEKAGDTDQESPGKS
jgi:formate dehydrogenase gamma subunit